MSSQRLRKRKFIHGPYQKRYVRPRGLGYLVPGTNYLGPGNPMDGAPPQSFADEAAQEHDTLYGEFEEQTGRNPKYEWITGADDVFVDRLEDDDSLSAMAAKAIFKTKRKFAELGLIPTSHVNKWSRVVGIHYSKCHLLEE